MSCIYGVESSCDECRMCSKKEEKVNDMEKNYKCLASQDGICRNIHAFGIKCNGYSEKCKLRPHYNTIQNTANRIENTLRNIIGIVCDQEE